MWRRRRFRWRTYVPVARRRYRAGQEMEKLARQGQATSPVVIDGRTIARTFWGRAWCDNLESYSDFSNRLPRGRTYVRNGSVLDLQMAPGKVQALVSGRDLYTVAVSVTSVPRKRWNEICTDCAGGIDSLVELLQGRFSKGVMERICRQKTGLFPSPAEVKFTCSCPDWASMCKHVAAVFYGIGARLDEQPELLFRLRQVDEKELIAGAGRALPLSRRRPAGDRVLAGEDLSALFGLELGSASEAVEKAPASAGRNGRAPATSRAARSARTASDRAGGRTPARRAGSRSAPAARAGGARGKPRKKPGGGSSSKGSTRGRKPAAVASGKAPAGSKKPSKRRPGKAARAGRGDQSR